MIRRPPRSTQSRSSAASDVYKRQKYIEKQLGKMFPTPLPNWDTYLWEQQNTIENTDLLVDTKKVIDVSEFVDENGQLNWDAPEGEWTIMRIGMTPTGTKNSPSAPQGQGYEIDKMNSKLAKFHFDNFVGEFLKRIPCLLYTSD